MYLVTPSSIAFLVLALLGMLMLSAARSDIRERRIPNVLVFPGACLGLLLNTLLPEGNGFASSLPGGVGFAKALIGLGLGLAIFLPFYAVRAMGAGDVKLMAMTGAFLGPNGTVESIVIIFLVGGVVAVIYLLRKKAVGLLFQNLHAKLMHTLFRMTVPDMPKAAVTSATAGRIPFGAVIAVGSTLYSIMARNGVLSIAQVLSIT